MTPARPGTYQPERTVDVARGVDVAADKGETATGLDLIAGGSGDIHRAHTVGADSVLVIVLGPGHGIEPGFGAHAVAAGQAVLYLYIAARTPILVGYASTQRGTRTEGHGEGKTDAIVTCAAQGMKGIDIEKTDARNTDRITRRDQAGVPEQRTGLVETGGIHGPGRPKRGAGSPM